MFDLELPWWEFIVRAALVYSVLLVMVRVSGKRTVGQFTPFDLLVVMLLSESVSSALSGGDNSVGGGLLLAGTLIAMNMGVAFITSRNAHLQRLVEGEPRLIGRDGEIFRQVLKSARIPLTDLEQALREADCELDEMACAFLEVDGQISILKKKG